MVDQKTAQRAGIAFKLGVAFGRGMAYKKQLTEDAAKLKLLEVF